MRVLVVSHDPGGAEILSSWVRRSTNNQYKYILGGPAKSIFEKKIKALVNIDISNLYSEIKNHNMVITGTSQNSNLEKLAIQIAREENINVVTFLDYWVNFYNRFELDGDLIYPNEIWVTDEIASQNAKNELPGSKIILKDNPYIMDFLDQKVATNHNDNEMRILYLCQPYNEDGFTDAQGLEYFFTLTKLANINKKVRVRVRLHPLEDTSKYKEIINAYLQFFDIEVCPDNLLVNDLNWSQYVVGMHTNALAVAVAFDLKVYCCIPSDKKPCVLPHSEIQDYKNIFYGI
jgi:hypothetical protein